MHELLPLFAATELAAERHGISTSLYDVPDAYITDDYELAETYYDGAKRYVRRFEQEDGEPAFVNIVTCVEKPLPVSQQSDDDA